jgi:hypothetical protein
MFAQQHNRLGTAGSDAHSSVEYGRATLKMPPFEGAGDFLASLRQAAPVQRLSPPHVHLYSTIAKWTKKLGLRPRLWEGG